MFPSPPFLHRVLTGGVPRLHRYYGAIRHPAPIPPRSHCSLGGTTRSHLVRISRRMCGTDIRGPGGKYGCPRRRLLRGDDRASQVPGEPRCEHAPLHDPGGPTPPGTTARTLLSSAKEQDVDSRNGFDFEARSRGLLAPCVRFAPRRYPRRTQHSVPAGAYPLPGGVGYPLGSIEKFQHLHRIPSSQASPGARSCRITRGGSVSPGHASCCLVASPESKIEGPCAWRTALCHS